MTTIDDTLADVLQECLDRLSGGATIEQCVQHFPQLRGELEPLLHTVAGLVALPRPTMPAAALASIETRVLQQVALRRAMPAVQNPAPHPLPAILHGLPLWVIAVALAIVLAILLAFSALLRDAQTQPRPGPVPASTNAGTTTRPDATASVPGTPVPGALPGVQATVTALPGATATPSTTDALAPMASPASSPAPGATVQSDELLVPMATVTPGGATSTDPIGGGTGDQGSTDSGATNDKDKKPCRGLEIGRDEKHCEPEREPPQKDKPARPTDKDNGSNKGNDNPGKKGK